jgi:hypothetical protein
MPKRRPTTPEVFDYEDLIWRAEYQSDSSWPKLLGRALASLYQETALMRHYKGRDNMSNNNVNSMFEVASRAKIRFQSVRNELTVEQLWDVPLRSKDDFNLDVIAKTANKALKTLTEESFVETRKTPAQSKAELALDIVKYVIQTKLDEEAEAERRAANRVKKEALLKAIAEKQEGKLSAMSEKELLKQLNELDV